MNKNLEEIKSRELRMLDIFEDYPDIKYIGTPCGILKEFFSSINKRKGMISSPREDNSLALAAGLTMANRIPIVLMQNSGFGQSINVLSSLIKPYKIPLLMIIGLRGYGSDNTEENSILGNSTMNFLTEMKIEYKLITSENYADESAWAIKKVVEEKETIALLIPPEFTGWRYTE